MNLLRDDTPIYVGGLGGLYRVTGLFIDDDAANAWMEANPGNPVLATSGPIVFCVARNDMGTKCPELDQAPALDCGDVATDYAAILKAGNDAMLATVQGAK